MPIAKIAKKGFELPPGVFDPGPKSLNTEESVKAFSMMRGLWDNNSDHLIETIRKRADDWLANRDRLRGGAGHARSQEWDEVATPEDLAAHKALRDNAEKLGRRIDNAGRNGPPESLVTAYEDADERAWDFWFNMREKYAGQMREVTESADPVPDHPGDYEYFDDQIFEPFHEAPRGGSQYSEFTDEHGNLGEENAISKIMRAVLSEDPKYKDIVDQLLDIEENGL